MNFYSMTIVLALIIAICYLAKLYAQYNAIKGDTTTLRDIGKVLADIRLSLWNIEKKIKDDKSATSTED